MPKSHLTFDRRTLRHQHSRLHKRPALFRTGARIATALIAGALSVFAQAAEVSPTDDAEVRASNPNTRFGGRNSMTVREAQIQQTLMKFDLTSYSGPILNATLTLSVGNVFREGSFEVRRVLADWDEGSIRFNNRPAIGSQVSATQAVTNADANRTIEVDVTALVQALVDDPLGNFGLALVPMGPIYVQLDSRETANGPILSVETEGPPPLDPLSIDSVFVGESELTITGQNFDNGEAPAVTLSGVGTLDVSFFFAQQIVATFPDGEISDGDYSLTVTTGTDAGQSDAFDLTVGAVGNEGPPGPPGPQGPAGPQGETGPQGEQGVAGPAGPAGADGVAGADGAEGPMGPPGVMGEDGANGAAGEDGAPGPQGEQGIPGVAGAQGPQGDQGVPGLAGADGAQGQQGDQGIPGLAGADGAQGPQGDQGIPGLAGADGAQGPQGDQGIPGIAGPVGPAGEQGDTGPFGPPGPPGMTGADGTNGAPGADGAVGPQGLAGPAGPEGPAGADGLPGGISGYEKVQVCQLFSNSAAPSLTAVCPAGKKVLGGGGGPNQIGYSTIISQSASTGEGWFLLMYDPTPPPTVNICVEAFCANAN